MQGIKPTGKRVLLKRLDGDGREEQLASGIIMPARDQSLRHGNAERVPDTFRALVLAVGEGAEKATQGELERDQIVICHTYEQTNTRTLVGDETPYGLLVDVDNILGVEEETQAELDRWKDDAEREAAFEASKPLGLIAKTKDFEPPSPLADAIRREQDATEEHMARRYPALASFGRRTGGF